MIPAATPPDCPPVEQRRPLGQEELRQLATRVPPEASGQPRPGYGDRLQPSSIGWVTRAVWCVWIEPDPNPDLFSGRWRRGVDDALGRWSHELTLRRVDNPEDAQLRLWRRRPPRLGGRASWGRALLALQMVRRGGPERLEPLVEVLLDPGQRLHLRAGEEPRLVSVVRGSLDATAESGGPRPRFRLARGDTVLAPFAGAFTFAAESAAIALVTEGFGG